MKNFGAAWLTTNRNCNNNCSWCYAKNTLKNNCMMNIDKAKLAVDELQRRNVKKIVLIGGEPTIYPYFIELISYIHKKGIKVSVASNGRMFKDIEFAQKVKEAGVFHVDMSIKATNEEMYIKNTQVDGYQQMIEGYHNMKKVGINVSASYLITNDDKNEFNKLIEFLQKENINSILFEFVKPCLTINDKEKVIGINKMGKFVTYIYNRMKETSIQYGIELSLPICMLDMDVFNNLVAEKRVSNSCHVTKGTGINFDENFRVIPCNHFAQFPFSEIPINFDNPNEIDELMEKDIVKKYREAACSYPTLKCQTCDKWSICGGGCFARWFSEDPNYYIK
ncbi:MAG: radical SAM protein [Clostridiales bacterium]|nr:radical SAM protein [Clostridiales bacterium]